MNKLITGVVITIVAIGAVIGIVVINHNNQKAAAPATTDDHSAHTHDEAAETPTDTASTDSVTISNYSFLPGNLTVKKGTAVTWTNTDSIQHTVTSDDGSVLSSELLDKGKTYSHTFNEVGTYSYHCDPHPYMKGSVIVTE